MFAVDAPGGAVLPVSSRKEKKEEEELVLFYLGFMLLQKKQKIKKVFMKPNRLSDIQYQISWFWFWFRSAKGSPP